MNPTTGDSPTQSQPEAAPPTPKRGATPWVITAVVALLIVAGVATYLTISKVSATSTKSGAAPMDPRSALQIAAEACGIGSAISDGGHTLSMSRVAAEEAPGPISYDEYTCAMNKLAVPHSVLDHIGTTRALDGMQEDSWGDYKARWTYHPDNGISMTITEK